MVDARAATDVAADPGAGEREAVLRRHNQLLLRLGQSEAIDDGDLARALPLLTEIAAEGFQIERTSIWLYTADRGAIECLDLYQRSRDEHLRGGQLQARDFPGYFAALAEARTIAATDAHTHPATREFSEQYLGPLGIGAMLEAPIRRRGRLIGVLCNEHVGPAREFSPDEQSFAATIADTVARALDAADRRRAEDELARAKAELEALADENRALIERLRSSLDALSSPVLEVWSDVLAMPVIGALDDRRCAQMTERLLADLTRTRARHVIIDLTGLDDCDLATAAAIAHMARAVRLIGAECILTGVQPRVAQAFVDLDFDLRGTRVGRDMRQALYDIVARHANKKSHAGG